MWIGLTEWKLPSFVLIVWAQALAIENWKWSLITTHFWAHVNYVIHFCIDWLITFTSEVVIRFSAWNPNKNKQQWHYLIPTEHISAYDYSLQKMYSIFYPMALKIIHPLSSLICYRSNFGWLISLKVVSCQECFWLTAIRSILMNSIKLKVFLTFQMDRWRINGKHLNFWILKYLKAEILYSEFNNLRCLDKNLFASYIAKCKTIHTHTKKNDKQNYEQFHLNPSNRNSFTRNGNKFEYFCWDLALNFKCRAFCFCKNRSVSVYICM